MAETNQIIFSYKELAEMMVKKQGIHEGLWGVFLKFGIKGANLGSTPEEVLPAAIIPILQIGLQRFDEPSRLTVDAAEVNPIPSKSKSRRKGTAKAKKKKVGS